jgi:hypothetical protein
MPHPLLLIYFVIKRFEQFPPCSYDREAKMLFAYVNDRWILKSSKDNLKPAACFFVAALTLNANVGIEHLFIK